MSLETTIKDCQKLLDFLLSELRQKNDHLSISDLGILGLFKSFIDNATAISVLEQSGLAKQATIIERVVLEQSTYFDFIFYNNSKKDIQVKAKALYLFQKIDGLKKIKKYYYSKSIDQAERDEARKEIDRNIRQTHPSFNDLNEYLEFLNVEYRKLFREKAYKDRKTYNKMIEKWYNVQGGHYKTFHDLVKDVGGRDEEYILFSIASGSVHGTSDVGDIYANYDENSEMSIFVRKTDNKQIEYLTNSWLSFSFLRIANYYNVSNIKWIKGIFTKIKINTKNNIKNNR